MTLPRTLIEQHLATLNLTPMDFARQQDLSWAILHQLLAGEYPHEVVALHRLGRAIGAEPEQWADTLAAGICRLSAADARASVRGRLWSHLILHGTPPAELAAAHGIPPRSLQLSLATGRMSRWIRASTLPTLLGFSPNDPALLLSASQTVSPALQELIQRRIQENTLTCDGLALKVQAAPTTLRALARGMVPPKLNPVIVPRLAARLHIDLDQLAHLLALTWRTTTTNHGTVKYHVIRYGFRHGIPIAGLARHLHLTDDQLRHLLSGRSLPAGPVCERLRAALNVPIAEWEKAVTGQQHRGLANSRSYLSLQVKPLHELIRAAAAAAGVDYLSWAKGLGIPTATIHSVMRQGRRPTRVEVRVPLMRGLGLDRATFNAAVRRMAEVFWKEDPLALIVARNGLQEQVLGLVRRQGLRTRELGRAMGISRQRVELLVRFGVHAFPPAVLERIRAFLGVTPEAFAALLEPVAAPADVEDDVELRLLRVFRKLTPDRQTQLLGISGRLLAENRPLTLVART